MKTVSKHTVRQAHTVEKGSVLAAPTPSLR